MVTRLAPVYKASDRAEILTQNSDSKSHPSFIIPAISTGHLVFNPKLNNHMAVILSQYSSLGWETGIDGFHGPSNPEKL